MPIKNSLLALNNNRNCQCLCIIYNITYCNHLTEYCLCLVTSVYQYLLGGILVQLVLLEPSVMMDYVVSLLFVECDYIILLLV